MDLSILPILPIVLLVLCAFCLAVGLLIVSRVVNPIRPGPVKRMPYESGMDPIHDARRRFDVRFFLLAIAFLVFDVEILFLYPWAVAFGSNDEYGVRNDELSVVVASHHTADIHPSSFTLHPSPTSPTSPTPRPRSPAPTCNRHAVFAGAMTFLALLAFGFIYDWRKGVFQWR